MSWFYVNSDRESIGPLTQNQMSAHYNRGDLFETAFCWNGVEVSTWKPLNECSLFNILEMKRIASESKQMHRDIHRSKSASKKKGTLSPHGKKKKKGGRDKSRSRERGDRQEHRPNPHRSKRDRSPRRRDRSRARAGEEDRYDREKSREKKGSRRKKTSGAERDSRRRDRDRKSSRKRSENKSYHRNKRRASVEEQPFSEEGSNYQSYSHNHFETTRPAGIHPSTTESVHSSQMGHENSGGPPHKLLPIPSGVPGTESHSRSMPNSMRRSNSSRRSRSRSRSRSPSRSRGSRSTTRSPSRTPMVESEVEETPRPMHFTPNRATQSMPVQSHTSITPKIGHYHGTGPPGGPPLPIPLNMPMPLPLPGEQMSQPNPFSHLPGNPQSVAIRPHVSYSQSARSSPMGGAQPAPMKPFTPMSHHHAQARLHGGGERPGLSQSQSFSLPQSHRIPGAPGGGIPFMHLSHHHQSLQSHHSHHHPPPPSVLVEPPPPQMNPDDPASSASVITPHQYGSPHPIQSPQHLSSSFVHSQSLSNPRMQFHSSRPAQHVHSGSVSAGSLSSSPNPPATHHIHSFPATHHGTSAPSVSPSVSAISQSASALSMPNGAMAHVPNEPNSHHHSNRSQPPPRSPGSVASGSISRSHGDPSEMSGDTPKMMLPPSAGRGQGGVSSTGPGGVITHYQGDHESAIPSSFQEMIHQDDLNKKGHDHGQNQHRNHRHRHRRAQSSLGSGTTFSSDISNSPGGILKELDRERFEYEEAMSRHCEQLQSEVANKFSEWFESIQNSFDECHEEIKGSQRIMNECQTQLAMMEKETASSDEIDDEIRRLKMTIDKEKRKMESLSLRSRYEKIIFSIRFISDAIAST